MINVGLRQRLPGSRLTTQRDHLLRQICRLVGLTGCTAGGICLLAASQTGIIPSIIGIALIAAIAQLLLLHVSSGSVKTALSVVGFGAVFACILVLDPAHDPAALTAVAIVAGVATASVAVTLVTTRYGYVFLVLSMLVMVAVITLLTMQSSSALPVLLTTAAGWATLTAIGSWMVAGFNEASHQVEALGRAHELERIASETEAQQRRDARLLHDTVLATLSLLSHSGRGVEALALRRRASEDAALLKQLRFGDRPNPQGVFATGPIGSKTPAGSKTSTADPASGFKTIDPLISRYAELGLTVNCHGKLTPLELAEEQYQALVGALNECLENVRRHAAVDQVDVTVTQSVDLVRIMITDNGAGFDPTAVDANRLGFAESIVGRVQAVGGNARVFSVPGIGTTVMFEVPAE